MMVAQECNLTPRFFIHSFGDAHIYSNHIEGVKQQLSRTPGPLPKVTISKKSIFDISFDDIQLHNYEPQPFIKFPVAV